MIFGSRPLPATLSPAPALSIVTFVKGFPSTNRVYLSILQYVCIPQHTKAFPQCTAAVFGYGPLVAFQGPFFPVGVVSRVRVCVSRVFRYNTLQQYYQSDVVSHDNNTSFGRSLGCRLLVLVIDQVLQVSKRSTGKSREESEPCVVLSLEMLSLSFCFHQCSTSRLLGNGTSISTHRETKAGSKLSTILVLKHTTVVIKLWPFCEGWRPVNNGTPPLTEWQNTRIGKKNGTGHSVRVGVP